MRGNTTMVQGYEDKDDGQQLSNYINTVEVKTNNLKKIFRRNTRAAALIGSLNYLDNIYDSAIFKAIDNAICNYYYIFYDDLPQDTIVYRARQIKTENIKKCNGINYLDGHTYGFNKQNSIEAPLGIPSPGRNNIKGMSYLYVAEDEATACAEIKTVPKSLMSLATFKVNKTLKIFNLCGHDEINIKDNDIDLISIFLEASMYFSKPVANTSEYELTQVISDYIRKTGVDGISYTSFFTGKKNYTIFNSHENNIQFVKSRLIANQGYIGYYWDFDNKKSIIAYQEGIDYKTNHSNDVMNFVRSRLK